MKAIFFLGMLIQLCAYSSNAEARIPSPILPQAIDCRTETDQAITITSFNFTLQHIGDDEISYAVHAYEMRRVLSEQIQAVNPHQPVSSQDPVPFNWQWIFDKSYTGTALKSNPYVVYLHPVGFINVDMSTDEVIFQLWQKDIARIVGNCVYPEIGMGAMINDDESAM